MDTKEQIRAEVDIVELVEEVATLKPSGGSKYKGLCPFHDEKTPSFHVMQDKGVYYCFGCHAKGDIFSFVMETHGVGFREALVHLGERAGIQVENNIDPGKAKREQKLREVCSLALQYYKENLYTDIGADALRYIRGRGINQEGIDEFELGYATDQWRGLIDYMSKRNVKVETLVEAGLIHRKNGSVYDALRGRLVFPIKDWLGRVVAFSGRTMTGDKAKYLNTLTSPIFDKSTILYGMSEARGDIRNSAECIIVEGYMDVIALRQVGVQNVVAALGTNLSQEQLVQLSRLDLDTVILAFDSDEAGQKATLASLDQTSSRKFVARAIKMPDGQDPADVALCGGKDAFYDLLAESISEVTFRFKAATSKHNLKSSRGKRDFLEELWPILKPSHLFDAASEEMQSLVVNELGVDPDRLRSWIKDKERGERSKRPTNSLDFTKRSGEDEDPLLNFQYELVALFLLEPEALKRRVWEFEPQLPDADSVLGKFFNICEERDFDYHEILLYYNGMGDSNKIFEYLFRQSDSERSFENLDRIIGLEITRLREKWIAKLAAEKEGAIKTRLASLSSAIVNPDTPEETMAELYTEIRELQSLLIAQGAERLQRVERGW